MCQDNVTSSQQHVEKWESEQMWPAHEVLKKLGSAGLLGVNKPVEYGGLGLDWKYNLAVLGTCCIFKKFDL